MTDNSDLLGADSSAAVPPTKAEMKRGRGRPKKTVSDPPATAKTETPAKASEQAQDTQAQLAGPIPVADPVADLPPTSGTLIYTSTDVTGALVDKAVKSVQDPEAAAVAQELAKLDAETAERKRQEAMEELLGVERKPAEVSADYALATANRITQGFAKREYAYQRLLRAGKKL